MMEFSLGEPVKAMCICTLHYSDESCLFCLDGDGALGIASGLVVNENLEALKVIYHTHLK